MISKTKVFFRRLPIWLSSLRNKKYLLGCIVLFLSIQHSNCMGREYESPEDAYRFTRGHGYSPYYSPSSAARGARLEPATYADQHYRPRSILSLPQSPNVTFNKHFYQPRWSTTPADSLILGTTAWRQSIEDQGELGTCASFATVEGLKFAHHNKFPSHAYLIVKAEQHEDCLNNGLALGIAMDTALNVGVIDQELWPYPVYTEAVRSLNSDTEDEEAWNVCLRAPFGKVIEKNLTKFAFKSVQSIFLADQESCKDGEECDFSKVPLILNTLKDTHSPVIISVPVESTGWPTSGVVEDILHNPEGFHAITIYGYDSRTGYFLFKNSWGNGWGEYGHGRISRAFVEKYASEAWVGVGAKLLAFTK